MNKSGLFTISLGTLAFSSPAMAHGGEYFFVWVLGIAAAGAVIGGVAGFIEARKQRHFGFVLLWSLPRSHPGWGYSLYSRQRRCAGPV